MSSKQLEPFSSSYVPKNINKHLLQDIWLSTLIPIAQQAQYGGDISSNVLDILFPVLSICYACQKQTKIPFGNNMLLEKE